MTRRYRLPKLACIYGIVAMGIADLLLLLVLVRGELIAKPRPTLPYSYFPVGRLPTSTPTTIQGMTERAGTLAGPPTKTPTPNVTQLVETFEMEASEIVLTFGFSQGTYYPSATPTPNAPQMTAIAFSQQATGIVQTFMPDVGTFQPTPLLMIFILRQALIKLNHWWEVLIGNDYSTPTPNFPIFPIATLPLFPTATTSE